MCRFIIKKRKMNKELEKKVEQAVKQTGPNDVRETWADIVGYEGKYQVSTLGRVRSLMYHNTKEIYRVGYLRPAKDNKGYLRCALSKDNKLKTYKVHRLVAMAFIPNPDNYSQVNHIDGNKENNSVGNLEWCDNSMNQLHAYKIGLKPPHKGGSVAVVLYDNLGSVIEFETKMEAANYLGYKSINPINRAIKLSTTCNGYFVKYKSMGRKPSLRYHPELSGCITTRS